MSQPELSVVVPVFNERDNVAPLVAEITAALRAGCRSRSSTSTTLAR
jgi:hypothetical protein